LTHTYFITHFPGYNICTAEVILPILHGVKVREEMELWLHLFLNRTLGGASGQLRAPFVYLRRKSPLSLLN